MRRRSIFVDGVHHGDQPFPLACVVDRLLVSSALHAMRPADGGFAETSAEQVAQVFENARLVLEAAGADFDDVVAMDVLIQDDRTRAEVNELWVAAFPDPACRPVRHTIVAPLREPLLVQLKLTAHLREEIA